MNVVELFAHNTNNWIDITLYGENWLVSQTNTANRVSYAIRRSNELRSTSNPSNGTYTFLFTFQNHLFQISDVKDVQIVDGKDTAGNLDGSKILLIMDEEEKVHFYGFSTLLQKASNSFKIISTDLGVIAWEVLKSYIKEYTHAKIPLNDKLLLFEAFAKKLAKNFQNGYFCPAFDMPFSHRDYSVDSNVPFFRVNACEFSRYDIPSGVLCVFEDNHRIYFRGQNEIFDTQTFESYSLDKFNLELQKNSLSGIEEIPFVYHLNDGRTLFFFTKVPRSNWEYRIEVMFEGYLWDATNQKLLFDSSKQQPTSNGSTFIVRYYYFTPHISLEFMENGEKLYHFWYQTPITKKIDCFLTKKLPIFLYREDTEQEIFFLEAEDFNETPGITPIMVILDKNFVVQYVETNVTLYDIIYPRNHIITRHVAGTPSPEPSTDSSLSNMYSFYTISDKNVLILKSSLGSMGELICYFITNNLKIDYSLSFFKYAPIPVHGENRHTNIKALKVIAERNGSDYENKTYYIDLEEQKMISFEEAVKNALISSKKE